MVRKKKCNLSTYLETDGSHAKQTTQGPSMGGPSKCSGRESLLSAAYRFLTLSNDIFDEAETLRRYIETIREVSTCTAVGMRIYNHENALVLSAHDGFTDDFLDQEGILSLENDQCLCTRVYLRQTDSSLPFFSDGGSFFTNRGVTPIKTAALQDLGSLRGTCFQAGFQSMGLFPIRSLNTVLGIVHVADHRPDRLPPDLVQLLENAALQLGIAIEKARAINALERINDELELRVNERTNDLAETLTSLQLEIEKRTAVERDLKKNQHLLQRVFESISDPLVLMDEDAHVLLVNQTAKQYYGVSLDNFTGDQKCFEGLGNYHPVCQSCQIPAAAKDGRRLEFERNGFFDTSRTEVVELFPIKNVPGKPRGAVMRIQDVTQSRAMQQKINQLQNQASIGMLLTSTAHEIKNPNSFITFNISVLKTYFEELLPVLDRHAAERPGFELANMPYEVFRKDVFKLMETIDHGSRRIDAVLGNLKIMNPNKIEANCIPMSLADVIATVLDTVQGKIERSVKQFDVLIQPDLPRIKSDPAILEQVILNLLVNAAQAADKADAYIRLSAQYHEKDGRQVILTVEDNGHGMSPQTQKRIFEPFYSTKIAEGGAGLGLYVCRNLINEIGGQLYLSSELGQGTRFTIELPVQPST